MSSLNFSGMGGADLIAGQVNNGFDKTSHFSAQLATGQRYTDMSQGISEMALANSFKGKIQSLEVAGNVITQAQSMLVIADSGMGLQLNTLFRAAEVAQRASAGTNSPRERAQLKLEFDTLKTDLDRIAENTVYGSTRLLDGTYGRELTVETAEDLDTLITLNDAGNNVGPNKISLANTKLGVLDAKGATGQTFGASELSLAEADKIAAGIEDDAKISNITIKFLPDGDDDEHFQASIIDNNGVKSVTYLSDVIANNDVFDFALSTDSSKDTYSLKAIVSATIDAYDGAAIQTSVDRGHAIAADLEGTLRDLLLGQVKDTKIQVGSDPNDSVGLNIENMSSRRLLDFAELKIDTQESAEAAQLAIESAIKTLGDSKASIGAQAGQLDRAAESAAEAALQQKNALNSLTAADLTGATQEFVRSSVMTQAAIGVMKANLDAFKSIQNLLSAL